LSAPVNLAAQKLKRIVSQDEYFILKALENSTFNMIADVSYFFAAFWALKVNLKVSAYFC
jgi:hypothetical protein